MYLRLHKTVSSDSIKKVPEKCIFITKQMKNHVCNIFQYAIKLTLVNLISAIYYHNKNVMTLDTLLRNII